MAQRIQARPGLVDDLITAAGHAERAAAHLERDRGLIPNDALVSGVRQRARLMLEAARVIEGHQCEAPREGGSG